MRAEAFRFRGSPPLYKLTLAALDHEPKAISTPWDSFTWVCLKECSALPPLLVAVHISQLGGSFPDRVPTGASRGRPYRRCGHTAEAGHSLGRSGIWLAGS